MSKKTIIVFTRYPEIGKTKTRLIPAIGAEKAANLQRKMTEKTLQKVSKIKENISTDENEIDVKIYYNGGSLLLMQQWLGHDLTLIKQIEGELGAKMYSALENNYHQNQTPVIIIGIDCPFLDQKILFQALTAVENNDLVIGKAEDGGYYLIGLNKPRKKLFDNINWGTDQVYNQTIQIAQTLNLSIHNLPVLKDIDRPEDLAFYPL
jgi:rSAM/selenodomain-associated transferase 1